MSQTKSPLITYEGPSLTLNSATEMPMASAFLWNPQMMIQANCRGYAVAQFMQPEPAKYAHAPNAEATHFMMPEQPFFAHHPGRFFYIKDLDTGTLFSAPHEPVRAKPDNFRFTATADKLAWQIVNNDLQIDITLSLSKHLAAELWQAKVTNLSERDRALSVTPYFPVGYMSWMNHSGTYNERLNAVICKSVTGYQKYSDYFKNKDFKDLTYFLTQQAPDSWEIRQSLFEGEGGLHSPSALENETLSNSDALYEIPAATVQYKLELGVEQSHSYKFVFGPAKDEDEIAKVRAELFDDPDGFDRCIAEFSDYAYSGAGPLTVSTPDAEFDNFVNHWLARQVFYHGDVNRLSTDPQTRNYLQDNMGMSYIRPVAARAAFLFALAQQNSDGAMPEGILLQEGAELKYINQVPHMDHCVWLPVCLSAYLDETNDYSLLDENIDFADSDERSSVKEHIGRAMHWLFAKRDHRGLNYIEQGDWNDPMNMVGYKGRGVSAWLTLATAYASNLWADTLEQLGDSAQANDFRANARTCNDAVNQHIWSDDWYGRGITDDDVLFGVAKDTEGRIFLNPQSWAILSGAADPEQQASLIQAVEAQLETPYGVEMLAPSYTKMRDDVGRVTQKHPGAAENGSVYNHATAFYIYALYQIQHSDRAFRLLRKMIPGPDENDLQQRGQLPCFIPNYYRGAYRQFSRTAGRSSQLFNTGTVHWVYRCLIDGLFGVQGCPEGLKLEPQLPNEWDEAKLTRTFRGAKFHISIKRNVRLNGNLVTVNDLQLSDNVIRNIDAGKNYQVLVELGGDTEAV